MSNNKQDFQWTDELVKEFINTAIIAKNEQPDDVELNRGIFKFKKSKEVPLLILKMKASSTRKTKLDTLAMPCIINATLNKI